MNPTRKTITLPSGASAKVRKLSALDMAMATGDIPVVSPEVVKASGQDIRDIEAGLKLVRAALTRCVGRLTYLNGTQLKIVAKSLDDSDDATEITIEELDQADADALVAEVFKLSGIGREAAQVAKPFLKESEENGADSQPRTGLPQAT